MAEYTGKSGKFSAGTQTVSLKGQELTFAAVASFDDEADLSALGSPAFAGADVVILIRDNLHMDRYWRIMHALDASIHSEFMGGNLGPTGAVYTEPE